mmetsp:Transcript_11901/g.12259  ORF Transcript_11901/g.12259 Transcript_11901/m.12259 type:complete len:861 (+) Transcript_11901:22-2604(+)
MDLIATIENLMSSDNKKRSLAEGLISTLAEEDFYNYLNNMCLILTGESYSLSSRQMASTLIKNPITHIPQYKEKWSEFSTDKKEGLKQLILSALGSENQVIRNSAGSVIASIAKVECPLSEKWPSLLPVLCQEKFDNISFQLAAIETLGYICEELSRKEILPSEVDQILSAFVLAIKNNVGSNEEVVVLALKGLIKIFTLIGVQKMSMQNYSDILMNEIFGIGNVYQSNNKILELISQLFIELAENYYDTIAFYLDKIAMYTFNLIKCNDERLSLLGFEFWCRLGSEELTRFNIEKERKISACKYYFQSNFSTLKEVIDKFIVFPQESEDLDDEWNTSKASCYILVILVQVISTESLDVITKEIRDTIKTDNPFEKKRTLLKLTCCFETSHKNIAFEISLTYLKKLFTMARTETGQTQIFACKALTKLTKIMGSFFQQNHLSDLIPTLMEMVFINNQIGIYICQTLNNIIKGQGDLNTTRGSNNMSPYFDNLLKHLVKCDENVNFFDRDRNLALHCLMTIEHLVDYSSHDKQKLLLEYLVFFVMRIKDIFNKTYLNTGSIIEDLEAQYCQIIRKIIKKLVTPLDIKDCTQIYEVIVQTFNRRKGVYEEGLIAISSMAVNMKENFTFFLDLPENNFNNFVKYSLDKDKYVNHFLVQSGIIALADIIKATSSKFSKYSKDYIPLLHTILVEEDIKKEVKLQVIALVGDICFHIGKEFSPFLKETMEILYGACGLALNHSQEDNDFEEYLQNLRFCLVETFTLVFFGLDDCGESRTFSTFVPNIFEFFKSLVLNQSYYLRTDTSRAILAFIIDMLNTYGNDIQSILDKNILVKLLEDLKETKIPKFSKYAEECEATIKLVWKN